LGGTLGFATFFGESATLLMFAPIVFAAFDRFWLVALPEVDFEVFLRFSDCVLSDEADDSFRFLPGSSDLPLE
jgi:hypothetical protein